MLRRRVPFMFPLAISLLAASPDAPQPNAPQPNAQGSFQVALTGNGGVDAMSVQTMRELVCAELRKRGHRVIEAPGLQEVISLTDEKRMELQAGGHRLLALRITGRLGAKLPLFLEEIDAQGSVIRSVTLTAAEVEECDVVIPRLVEALLETKPVDATARYDTLTEGESREVRTRPGTNHFALGMPLPLYSGSGDKSESGLSLGWLYTAKHWMLGTEFVYSTTGTAGVVAPIIIHGAWLPSDGNISPYFGAGIGYMIPENKDTHFDSNIGVRLSVGLEFFRLHRMRLQTGLDLYLPGSSRAETKYTYDSPQETVKARTSYLTFSAKVAF